MHRLYICLVLIMAGPQAGRANDHEPTPHQARALEIFRTIIGMRTAKGYGEVPAMAEYLAGQLKSAGFTDDDIQVVPHGETAALIVRYRGDGSGESPVLFLAHMDIVDAIPEDWDHPPFEVHEDGEYFLGRGTDDNKYGVMNLTQAFMRLKQEGFTPDRDLVLAFSGDEETAQETTRLLVERLSGAEFALNADSGGGVLAADGSPLAYNIQSAEKTYATFAITARNPGGHSSLPRRDNAIYDIAEALLKIRAHEFPVMANAILRESLRAEGEQMGGALGEALIAFAEDPGNAKAINTIRGNEDYDHMLSTTCVATMLDAGHAENALPQAASATVNCRIFPGIEVEQVRQTLVRLVDNEDLEVRPLDEYFSSPASEPRADVYAAVGKAVHARYPGLKVVPSMSMGATDALHFRAAGIPTYGVASVFARPGATNAHGVNERIPVKTFYAGLDHWIMIIRELAGPGSP